MKITFQVDKKTGMAYQKATPEEQERVRQRTQQFIQRILITREEAAEEFRRITEKTGAYAKAQGWRGEMSEALLRGDYDHD